MTQSEQEFTTDLRKNMDAAQRECAVEQKRLAADAHQYGGVGCAKELIRRGRLSDGFAALAQAGRLDLSLEALVVTAKYGALFTDDEVNTCFNVLCDAGYYVWSRQL